MPDLGQRFSVLSKELLTFVGQGQTLEIASELDSLLVSIKAINLDHVLNPGFISRVWTAVLCQLSLRETGVEELTLKVTDLTRSLEEAKIKLRTEKEALSALESKFSLCLGELGRAGSSSQSADDLPMQGLAAEQSIVQLRRLQDLYGELLSKVTLTLEVTLPLWKSLIFTILKKKKIRELDQTITDANQELQTSVGEALRAYHEELERKKVIDHELLQLEKQLLLSGRKPGPPG